MSSYPLDGKYALVTGAGSGIGHALTKLLLSHGCSVMLADLKLRPEAYQTLNDYSSTSTPVTAVFHPTDVSDWKQLNSLWEAAVQTFGRVDIVASVAGIYEPPSSNFWNPPGISSISGDPADASNGQYKTFAVNQVAPIRLAQMAIDYWTQHREIQGNFLVVASISAYLHSIETPLYMASKAALVSFVKSLGGLQDLFGIRISAVCPGPVLTPIFEPGWNKKLTADDVHLTPDECASVILRVLQEPQWGNGSIVETQRIGDKEMSEITVQDVHLERLYPEKYGKPSARIIESRQNLVKRIQATGLRGHDG